MLPMTRDGIPGILAYVSYRLQLQMILPRSIRELAKA